MAESGTSNPNRVHSGKIKNKRRRSSLTRGRRSSIGIILAECIENAKEAKKDGEKELETITNNHFKSALKEILNDMDVDDDKVAFITELRQIQEEVITEMKNDNAFSKALNSKDDSLLQADIDCYENYSKKLENECEDWDNATEKLSKDKFKANEIQSEVKIDATPFEETELMCTNALKSIKQIKENVLLQTDKVSTEVDCQMKISLGIKNSRGSNNINDIYLGIDKLPQPDLKKFIREFVNHED